MWNFVRPYTKVECGVPTSSKKETTKSRHNIVHIYIYKAKDMTGKHCSEENIIVAIVPDDRQVPLIQHLS